MKKFKIVGLCLVAVFAISAVVASTASAVLPEFSAGAKEEMKFTSKSGAATLKVKGGITVKCSASTNEGVILPGASKKEGSVTVKFTGCLAAGVDECHSASPPAKPGEIITSLLKMELGYISKAKKEVGVDLSAATLAEFTCEIGTGETVKVTGSVIGKITPINVLTNTFELELTEASEKQVPEKFEGKPEDTLKSSINGATPLASTEKTNDTVELGEEEKEGKKIKIELEILG
jgi:hypothetical protein